MREGRKESSQVTHGDLAMGIKGILSCASPGLDPWRLDDK
jgi:hypothetical protein